MQERVGVCRACGKAVYCNDGFLTGVVQEDHSLLCFECLDNQEKPSFGESTD